MNQIGPKKDWFWGSDLAMESPLLRAGVAAAQLALGVSPNSKKEAPDSCKSEEKKSKSEVKKEEPAP